MYNGKKLRIAPFADLPYPMRPGGRFSPQVQAVLDRTEMWSKGENPIETMRFDAPIFPMAIQSEGRDVTWGVHRGHRAKNPGLSPFVEGRARSTLIGYLTIELEGSGDAPLLTRAYGGRYTPPLPWMASARDAEGGKPACIEYWRLHAYLDRAPSLILSATVTKEQPDWYGEG